MKRIFLLLAMVGMTAFQSCSDDDTANQRDTDTIAEVFEINQNTTFNAANGYKISYSLDPQIYSSDMILVYRLSGADGSNDIWEPLPKTYYFDNGDELDYTFNFTVRDIEIAMNGNFDLATEPGYTLNQVFRVVIIPGYLSNRSATPSIDLSDYNAVIAAYNLNDSNIKTIGNR